MNFCFKKIHKITVVAGILVIAASLLIPGDPLSEMRLFDYATLYVAPVFGIVGIISSLIQRQYRWMIPNILLSLSFFIAMALAFIKMALS